MNVLLENPLENYSHTQECKLRENIKFFFVQSDASYMFRYGFGGHHLFVREIGSDKRIIFVEF